MPLKHTLFIWIEAAHEEIEIEEIHVAAASNGSHTHARTQSSRHGHDRKLWTIVSSSQKRPSLGSAAYLSIVYLEHSKVSPKNRVYCVNITKRCPSNKSRTPARLIWIVAGVAVCRVPLVDSNLITLLCNRKLKDWRWYDGFEVTALLWLLNLIVTQ